MAIVWHSRRFPISGATNGVVPFFEVLFTAGQRALTRPVARSDGGFAVGLALVQPAQQFPRLAGRQFPDLFNSDFDRAHTTYLTGETGRQQARFTRTRRANIGRLIAGRMLRGT